VRHLLTCPPKFFARTRFGGWAKKSLIRNVEFLEKSPSSKTRRNSTPSWRAWM